MASSTISHLSIFESENNADPQFTNKYAVTQFEAHKYCVDTAKAKAFAFFEKYRSTLFADVYANTSNEDFLKDLNPKIMGTQIDKPGIYLFFGLPVPAETWINVISVTKYKDWAWREKLDTKVIYTTYFIPMQRVKTVGSVIPAEIIQSSINTAPPKERDLADDDQRFLHTIESFNRKCLSPPKEINRPKPKPVKVQVETTVESA